MEPLDYLRVLRRRWTIVVGAPLLAFLVAYALTAGEPQNQPTVPIGTRYEATHTLYAGYADSPPPVPLDTMAFLATKGEIPMRVAEALDSDQPPAALAAQVSVTADARLGTLTFSTTQSRPDFAEDLVNTYAQQVLQYFADQAEAQRLAAIDSTSRLMEEQENRVRVLDHQLAGLPEGSAEGDLIRAERDAMVRQYSATVERFQTLSAQGEATAGLISLEEGTAIPVAAEGFQAPTTAGPRRLIATLMGLLLGLALAFVVDRLDTRIRTRRAAEAAFDLPVVAEVPKLRRRDRRRKTLVTVKHPASVGAESYRVLRLGLQLMSRWILPAKGEHGSVDGRPLERREAKGPANVVLVTSPGPGEGKSTTVANLAASFAEGGKVVLVLDCDFRNPQMHSYLGVDQSEGVTEYLLADGSLRLEDLAQETSIPGVWLVTAGKSTSHPAGLLGPDTKLLEVAAALADVVLIDVGPLLAVNEAATLAPRVDAVVLTARSGRTSEDSARRSTELLSRIEAPVLGVTLIGMPRSELGSSYHYPAASPSLSPLRRQRTLSKEEEESETT